MRVIKNKILVKKLEEETTTSSGIIFENTKSPTIKAEVKAVGGEVVDLRIGEVVIIRRQPPTLTENKVDYILITDSDILAVSTDTVKE